MDPSSPWDATLDFAAGDFIGASSAPGDSDSDEGDASAVSEGEGAQASFPATACRADSPAAADALPVRGEREGGRFARSREWRVWRLPPAPPPRQAAP